VHSMEADFPPNRSGDVYFSEMEAMTFLSEENTNLVRLKVFLDGDPRWKLV